VPSASCQTGACASWSTEEQLEAVAGGIALTGAVGEVDQSALDVSAATVDKASPVLTKVCATGVHLKDGVITVR
jgi:type VI protein secretion system component Hcp